VTSSVRHLKKDEPRFNIEVRKFKEYDTHCEPGLISILFLAFNKPELTKICLEATQKSLQDYEGEIEWCFMENGNNDENWDLFSNFQTTRKKLIRTGNWGITSAFNDLWNISRGEYCLVLENDFFNKDSVKFLQDAKDILDEDDIVGIVHLRAIHDPNENWGYKKEEFSPFSCETTEKYHVEHRETFAGHSYKVARYPNMYSNNPCLMRKVLRRRCGNFNEPEMGTDLRHDETHYQERINKAGYCAAHINKEIYYHVGGGIQQYFLAMMRGDLNGTS
jgi:GT2 family glycosyltransferase